MKRIEQLNESYRRFKHYKDTFGGVYIYPEYQKDLDTILQFVSEELEGLEIPFEHIPNAMI